jgi:ABC-type transport system involved in cytochrome c biogenesis permease subunit
MINLVFLLTALTLLFYWDYFGQNGKLYYINNILLYLIIVLQFGEILWFIRVQQGAFNTHISLKLLSFFIIIGAHYFRYKFRFKTLLLLMLPVATVIYSFSELPYFINKIKEPISVGQGILFWHIVFIILAYFLFTISALSALVYFYQYKKLKTPKQVDAVLFRLPSLGSLSRINYLVTSWGFILFTIGIILGAFWLKFTSGVYVRGELKIILTLIAWVLYIFYFHLKIRNSGYVKRRLLIVLLAYAVIMSSYFFIDHMWG